MNPQETNPTNVQNSQKFEHHKGFFILNYDPIMTENHIVNVLEQYQLIEFKSGGKIDLRDVVFWHAAFKNGMLKIIVYDIKNKVLIQKIHDINNPDDATDWFLISEDYFGGELLEFQF